MQKQNKNPSLKYDVFKMHSLKRKIMDNRIQSIWGSKLGEREEDKEEEEFL